MPFCWSRERYEEISKAFISLQLNGNAALALLPSFPLLHSIVVSLLWQDDVCEVRHLTNKSFEHNLGVYMRLGRSQKECFKSNIIGIRDQCTNTGSRDSFIKNVRQVFPLLKKPSFKISSHCPLRFKQAQTKENRNYDSWIVNANFKVRSRKSHLPDW